MTATNDPNAWIPKALSDARFGKYLEACGDDVTAAFRLYVWTVRVCGAFYPLLHFAEVTLRNASHSELALQFGRDDWWAVAPLTGNSQNLVKKAQEKAVIPGSPPSANQVVAKLTLGFWVSLVSETYDRALWVPTLHRAFPHYRGRRDGLHTELENIRDLRNRVMHYAPLRGRDLSADHAALYRLYSYLSADLSPAMREIDQVPHVLWLR
ncbi:hypothetical protein JOF56_000899 [Kibdelosporangium banguiense]|uniref:Abi-like protein n=1 Tax=Kibdelosporangium banguiense TaxID=1365924 RepID=A0ABS4T9A5_9PSEU|nr:hypothetical protein [Kibdelosporangium banguiense]MBP2320514.1 hypothetical protein [Kibdelosporangium banguiense]